jgi:Cupin domain
MGPGKKARYEQSGLTPGGDGVQLLTVQELFDLAYDLEVAAQRIVFAVGAHSGWHSHPGPVFIQVVSGTMTFYEGNDPSCTPTVRHAGEGFLDVGDHAHIARNESSASAENLVVYFAPPRTLQSGLRIDQPRPGNRPF